MTRKHLDNKYIRCCKMRIGFCLPKYTLRGADVVLWAFAYFADGHSLPHESYIFVYDDNLDQYQTDVHEPHNREEAQKRFKYFEEKEGRIIITSKEMMETDMLARNIDVCYIYLAGFEDERALLPKKIPVVTHCIFNGMVHLGNCHTIISNSVPHIPNSKTRVLPNMLVVMNHDVNLRDVLNIPKEAVVFGRYGGYHTFSIPWVQEAVAKYAKEHPEVWFLMMNTAPFTDMKVLSNIVYIQGSAELSLKRAFINTCDVMLHARIDGETFGCAIGEFAVCKKPILTSPCLHRAFGYSADGHLDILGDRAVVYKNQEELLWWLDMFSKKLVHVNMELNGYLEYIPDKVMPIFEECLLEAIRDHSDSGMISKQVVEGDVGDARGAVIGVEGMEGSSSK